MSEERVVRVEASGAYDVVVGRGVLGQLGARMRKVLRDADDTVLLVTDDHVGPLYADRACASLAAAGYAAHVVTLPAGEPTKCLASYGYLLEQAAQAGLARASTVVALGGGVIGDLAGFVAATYMRGCHLVQAATSLLAMVDSSVGGKTAIDLPQGKNLAGAFYQPGLVLCDLDCLATLPGLYVSDGMGEVVKYGVMADPQLFGWLEQPVAGQEERVVERCVSIKRDVVQADEREAGCRKLLNLGHTVGHAIELLSGYRVPHGHAVAAGTAVMARACAARGWCSAEDVGRIEAMLAVHGLPTGTRRPVAALVEASLRDKKRAGDHIDVVLVRGVGASEVRRLSVAEYAELVALGCAKSQDVTYAEDGALVLVDDDAAPCAGESADARAVAPFAMAPDAPGTAALLGSGQLAGSLPAIASKSSAHRLLICAALADRPTRVWCPTTSQDIEATCDCLRSLGARVAREGRALVVEPIDRHAVMAARPLLNCGESGSTLRFLLPVACALGAEAAFDGCGRLPERPLEPLRTRLVEHGCMLGEAGSWPLETRGRIAGGVFDLPGNVSSQYVTGLLLALPLIGQGGRVRLSGMVESRPYIDMTISALRCFGVEVTETIEQVAGETLVSFAVPAQARYISPGEVRAEGDWSNAAFWLAAGALSDEPVTVTGLDLTSLQGDRAVLDILEAFGAYVRRDTANGSATSCGRDPQTGEERGLHGVTVDAHDVPDLVPVLAMVAACAQGRTRIENAARLRIKESDRLQTTTELLRRLGVEVEELPDGLVIHGRGDGLSGTACLMGCQVQAHGDHRIAMAAAVAATRTDGPVTIRGAQAVAKSYPGFFEDYRALGGHAELRGE